MSQDKIADLLSSIKNAYRAGKKQIVVPWSKLGFAVVKTLVKEGYLAGARKEEKKGDPRLKMALDLSYSRGKPALMDVKRISKPGRRVYVQAKELPSHERRLGIIILSTPQGVMTGKEAIKKNLGGELICRVW